MCGIAGIIYADASRPVAHGLLAEMGTRLAHRGPDGQGTWGEPGVGLVHRRLSIIDIEHGDQPLGNEDGSVQVVFNGEIYNYRELRKQLQARGHVFRTDSDTEVLVHLYEDHGDAMVDHLRGMFAFAIWDRKRRRLLLGRDRVGIKPLYVYRDAEKLVFASELKAILADANVQRKVNGEALHEYLAYGMVSGQRSIFDGIEKLPAGHVLVASDENLTAAPRRYWQLTMRPDHRRTPEEWQESIRAKMDETLRMHMISDVPVGAFLSGGIDSSIVVTLGSQAATAPMQTFSIGFREEKFSELPIARAVAAHCGTRHVEEIVTANSAELLDELTYFYDEPFADSSAIPTFVLSRLASRHVKVVLSGDGGDEAFGGYSRYANDLREAALRAWMPQWFRRTVLAGLASAWPRIDWLPRPLRAKALLTNVSRSPADAYANSLCICWPPLREQLLLNGFRQMSNGYDPESVVSRAYARAPSDEPLSGMITADVTTRLPDDYLVKVDRASMAHGLEVRPPLLDHELLELAAQIPSRWKVHHGNTKWILKESYRTSLPSTVLDHPKQGFEVPIDRWLRGPLRPVFESTVFSPNSPIADMLDRTVVRKVFDQHSRGTGRHGAVLWAILVLARWAERYLKASGNLRPPGGVKYDQVASACGASPGNGGSSCAVKTPSALHKEEDRSEVIPLNDN